jgi:hypothetical protein
MARVDHNPLLKGVSGAINKQFVLKQYNGKVIMTAFPDMSDIKPSELQVVYRGKFTLANAYSKKILRDPLWKEAYKAKVQGMQRANNIAVKDYYNPPSVESVSLDVDQRSGEHILKIIAIDDFKVIEVEVVLLDKDNNIVEKGSATETSEWNWKYVVEKDLETIDKIVVTAKDLPGNTDSKELSLS